MASLVPFNDLGRAARRDADELAELMNEVVASGWFVHGRAHARFESQLAEYLGVAKVLGVASGTDALELALRAVATAERRTVITAANAGGYTTCAAVAAGLSVRYCDIDPETHNLDPGVLEPLLDLSVAAVVVTHLYGRLAEIDAVRQLCEPLGIRVIEDCAQSIGARSDVGMAGSLGDLAAFSFYPTKNLGAIGDGGAIATNDADLAAAVSALRQYGWTSKYTNTVPGGRNSRLDELQAAVLGFRLTSLDADNQKRRDIISRYAKAATEGVRVLPAEGMDHVGHLAVVVCDAAGELRSHLSAHGVATDVHYPVPDYDQPIARGRHLRLPATDSLIGRIVSLPCFPELSDSEVERVCTALASFEQEV